MTDEVTQETEAVAPVEAEPVPEVSADLVVETVTGKSAREELIDYVNTLGELTRSTLHDLIAKL